MTENNFCSLKNIPLPSMWNTAHVGWAVHYLKDYLNKYSKSFFAHFGTML